MASVSCIPTMKLHWHFESPALITVPWHSYLTSMFVVPIYSLLQYVTCFSTCAICIFLNFSFSLSGELLSLWLNCSHEPPQWFLSHVPWNLYLDHIMPNITLESDENPSRCFHAKQPQKDRINLMYSDYPWKTYRVTSDF